MCSASSNQTSRYLLVPAGREGAEAMLQIGDAVHFVHEAFKHCKAICVVGEGVELLRGLGIGPDTTAPVGVVVAPTPVTNMGDVTAAQQIAQQFVAAIARHRHWERPNVDAVAA